MPVEGLVRVLRAVFAVPPRRIWSRSAGLAVVCLAIAALGAQPAVACSGDGECDDGQWCNGAETCVATVCQNGTPPTVPDSVSCTDDSCDEVNDVIVHAPNDSLCDNGAFCDGDETCDVLLDCQAGTPPTVPDSVSCTDDSCDEVNDVIVHAPNDSLCDNGAFCDGDETCDVLLDCQAGTPPDFSDDVDCTVDSCDETNDVIVHSPDHLYCHNGFYCDGEEYCDPAGGGPASDGCQKGTPPDPPPPGCDNLPIDSDGGGFLDYVTVSDFDFDEVLEMSDIQAAVDALTDPGAKRVRVRTGNYIGPQSGGSAPALALPSKTLIEGFGPGPAILNGFAPDDLSSTGAVVSNKNHGSGNTEITIRDVEIDGGWGSGDANGFGNVRMGVYFNYCDNCSVEDSEIHDTLHACLYTKNAHDVHFERNTLERCGNYTGSGSTQPCIYLYVESGRIQENIFVTDNSCRNSGTAALNSRRADPTAILRNVRFERNVVYDTRVNFVNEKFVPAWCISMQGVDGGFYSDTSCFNTGQAFYAASAYYDDYTDEHSSKNLQINGMYIEPAPGAPGLEISGFLADSSFNDIEVSNGLSGRDCIAITHPLKNVDFSNLTLKDCGDSGIGETGGGIAGTPDESIIFRTVDIQNPVDSAIRFKNPVQNVLFDGVTISGASGDGIEFENDVTNVAIRSAQISGVGGYGISMASGTVVDGFELTKSTIDASALGGIYFPLDDITPSGSIFVTRNSLEDCCSGASGSTSSILISGSAADISIDNNVLQDLVGDAEYGILHDIIPFNDPTYLCSNEFSGAFTTANRYSVPGYPEYQLDSDSDLSVDACDCAPFDGTTNPDAPEINDGIDNSCDGIVDEISGVSNFENPTLFVWSAQADATSYEVIRSDGPAFGTCATEIVTAPTTDQLAAADPLPEGTYFYLVRPLTPLTGSWGADSSGTERTGLCSN